MSAHEDPEPGSAADWLARAKGNLIMARQPKPEGAFWEDYCYQAQQAAEKAIKAVFIHEGMSFSYTHDLGQLGTELECGGVAVPGIVREAVSLTRYAVRTRYPAPFLPVTEEEHREAIRLAEAVVAWAQDSTATVQREQEQ
ncbi:MAG: HEPN domain-containing protein [Armatimonadetes bacterium]|nr:HEPN domain-containing protein [Armatimonadota bacterium]